MKYKNVPICIALLFLLSLVNTSYASEKELTLTARQGSLMDQLSFIILEEAYQQIGYDLIMKELPGSRALHEANIGQTDGVVTRLAHVLKKYDQLIKIDVPIWTARVTAFSKNDYPKQIENWDSLKGVRLGSFQGYKFVENKLKDENLLMANTFSQTLQLMDLDRIDVAILGMLDGLASIERHRHNDFTCHPALKSFPQLHLLHNKNEKIAEKIEPILMDMYNTGRIREIQLAFLKNNLGEELSLLCKELQ